MNTPALMRAIAARIAAHKSTLGLAGVSYPASNSVKASPWAMVRQSNTAPSTVEKLRLGQQVHLPAIDVVLLVTSDVTRPADAARLDTLIDPICDLFDSAAGTSMNALMPELDGHLDRVWSVANIRRLAVEWGEAGYCHAAVITFDAKFRRAPVAIEMENEP